MLCASFVVQVVSGTTKMITEKRVENMTEWKDNSNEEIWTGSLRLGCENCRGASDVKSFSTSGQDLKLEERDGRNAEEWSQNLRQELRSLGTMMEAFHSSFRQNLFLGSYGSKLLTTGNFRRPACPGSTCKISWWYDRDRDDIGRISYIFHRLSHSGISNRAVTKCENVTPITCRVAALCVECGQEICFFLPHLQLGFRISRTGVVGWSVIPTKQLQTLRNSQESSPLLQTQPKPPALDMVMVDTEPSWEGSPSWISIACGKWQAKSRGMLRYQWPHAARCSNFGTHEVRNIWPPGSHTKQWTWDLLCSLILSHIIPVEPQKAVAQVSKIDNLWEVGCCEWCIAGRTHWCTDKWLEAAQCSCEVVIVIIVEM